MAFEKSATTPPFSPTFMIPIQRVRTPVNPNDISKPVLAMSKVDATMVVKTSVSPKKMSFTRPMTNAMRKKNRKI